MSESEILIEKNVPMPPINVKPSKYPFLATMEVGDSVLLHRGGVDASKVINRMRTAMFKANNMKVAYRMEGPDHIRIWRRE